MNYLLNTVNTYRVPTEQAALALRDELNDLACGDLTAFSYKVKEVKQKGQVVETYVVVKATITFTSEKDPDAKIKVEYSE